MIELPTPYIINTYHEDDVHTHTALFTANQMSDYGRAEYLSAIEQAAQPVREPCKTLCELCVKRGYIGCANTSQTTPIVVAQPKGLFVDMIAAQGPEFVAEMAKICVQHDCDECKARAAQPIEPTHYLDAMGLCYTAERAKFIGIDVASMVALYAAPRIAQQVREPVAMEDAESLLQDVSAYIGVGGFNGATPKQLSERICVEFERLNNKAQTAQPVLEPLSDEQIEKLRDKTFSINNPFCPVDSKSMRKAVRAAERAHGIGGDK